MRRLYVWVLAAAALPLWVGQFPSAYAAPTVLTPPGYRVVQEETLHAGVHHVELVKDDGPQRVHVAAVDPKAGARIVPVLSSGQVGGATPRLERTSAMCARVECVVAVNADFFHVETEQPVGGFAAAGELMRSPVNTHHQLFFDAGGKPGAAVLSAAVRVVSTDLQELATPHLNVARGDNGLVVYTPAFGPTTRTNPFGAELVGRVVRPKGGLRIGQTAMVKIEALRDGAGDTPIPRDGVVLSGHGTSADQLRQLWQRAESGSIGRQLLVRVETSAALTDTVGGAPVLVREGRSFVADDGSVFVRGRHPRTVVGWTAAGILLLVTADGRQPGHAAGLSLPETAELMVALGAVEAINLDGGGSTTFVKRGHVVNRPSDQLVERSGLQQIVSLISPSDKLVGAVERPTISALAVVVSKPLEATKSEPPVGDDLELPTTVELPAPIAADPASNPSARLPALVGAVDARETGASMLELFAAVLMLSVAGSTVLAWRRSLSRQSPPLPE